MRYYQQFYGSPMPLIAPVTGEILLKARDILLAGGLIGLPTETVYGLAGDARQDKAVAAIYALKKRPQFNPLIIHFATADEAFFETEAQDVARMLAQQFWPGPLTLVLPRRKDSAISLLASSGLDTLAVRVPAHADAQAVLRSLGGPLAAPSANRSGHISPTTPLHVAAEFGDDLPLILAGGKSMVGLESTVIDLSGDAPTILRPGAVTCEQIAACLECDVRLSVDDPSAPKSPGQMARHYAPNKPLYLNVLQPRADMAFLAFGPVLKGAPVPMQLNLSETGDLTEAAANLFAMLRTLDASAARCIGVMPIPENGLGRAINDRLKRAGVRDV